MPEPRNASVAIVGAGDYIGAAIARRFAREGYLVHAGRRNGEKLQPLVAGIEAAGGRCVGRTLDAREEDAVGRFSWAEADAAAPLEVAVFNIGANVNFPLLDTTERVFRRSGNWPATPGFCRGGKRPGPDAAARPGLDLPDRRDRQRARRQGLCRVRQRQVRAARGGAEHGAGVGASGHPCRASGDRRRRRYRVGAGTDQRRAAARRRNAC